MSEDDYGDCCLVDFVEVCRGSVLRFVVFDCCLFEKIEGIL
jgi:hypothetical protein